jgi:hypothetical protein
VFIAHLVLTIYAVSATGNHWWLDGIAAIALLGIALRINSYLSKMFQNAHVFEAS